MSKFGIVWNEARALSRPVVGPATRADADAAARRIDDAAAMMVARIGEAPPTVTRFGRPTAGLDDSGMARAVRLLDSSFTWVDDTWCVGRAGLGAELVNVDAARRAAGGAADAWVAGVIMASNRRVFHVAPTLQRAGDDLPVVRDQLAAKRLLTPAEWAERAGVHRSYVRHLSVDELVRETTQTGSPTFFARFYGDATKHTTDAHVAGTSHADLVHPELQDAVRERVRAGAELAVARLVTARSA